MASFHAYTSFLLLHTLQARMAVSLTKSLWPIEERLPVACLALRSNSAYAQWLCTARLTKTPDMLPW